MIYKHIRIGLSEKLGRNTTTRVGLGAPGPVGLTGMIGLAGLLGLVGLMEAPLLAAPSDPAELSVQIDGKVMPIDLKGLKDGGTKTLEHNGHKVVVSRTGGALQLLADGDKVQLGEGGNSHDLKCVVKVGTIDPDDATVIDLPQKGQATAVTVMGGGSASASASAPGASARIDSKSIQTDGGEVRVQVENGVRTVTVTGPDGKVQQFKTPVDDDDDDDVIVHSFSSGGPGTQQRVEVRTGDASASSSDKDGDGKKVIVQKRVMIEKTDDGIEGSKVVVRCVGDAPGGGEGEHKKIIIIHKDVEK